MLLLVVGLLTSRGVLADNSFTAGHLNLSPLGHVSPNTTIKLVDKIRRQLMEDNYDYQPSEDELMSHHKALEPELPSDSLYHDKSNDIEDNRASNDTGAAAERSRDLDNHAYIKEDNYYINNGRDDRSPPGGEGEGRKPAADEKGNYNWEGFVTRPKDMRPVFRNEFVPRAIRDKEHLVSKKDLLYYIDDERLRTERRRRLRGRDNASAGLHDAEEATSTTAKYKVIKVKSLYPNRRTQQIHRFIQEETPDGMAIINLGEAPFPEFHLPRGRRQYMHDKDSGDVSDASARPALAPLQARRSGAQAFEDHDSAENSEYLVAPEPPPLESLIDNKGDFFN